MAVLPQQVEHHVNHGYQVHLPAHLGLRCESHSLLDLFEARTSFFVQGDHLTIEDDLARAERPAHQMDLRVASSDIFAAAAHQPDAAAFDVRERPDAVPLELEAPG